MEVVLCVHFGFLIDFYVFNQYLRLSVANIFLYVDSFLIEVPPDRLYFKNFSPKELLGQLFV